MTSLGLVFAAYFGFVAGVIVIVATNLWFDERSVSTLGRASQLPPMTEEEAEKYLTEHSADDPWTVPLDQLARLTQAALIIESPERGKTL